MITHTLTPLRRGQLSIAAAAVAWGAGGAAAEQLFRTSGLGPLAVSFWRFAIAAAILIAKHVQQQQAEQDQHVRQGVVGGRSLSGRSSVATGIALAVYQTAYFGAVQNAGLALGTLITLDASPILVGVGAHVLLKERLTRRGGAAIGLALLGLLLLVARPESGPRPLLGVVLALLSAVGYSAVTLRARHAGGTTSAGPATWAIGALCLLPFALAEGAWPSAGHAVESTTWLVFLGIVPTLLAYRWYFSGLATVTGTTAAVLVLLEPATAVLLAVLLGERITTALVLGSVLLLTAIAVLARDRS
ncbi:DMT family transporter [Streptomyces sp. NBC_00285]|uniref:DMT family transporter n=1 Tax=Streptomyces sp. NBC_00285 TaxID=2975700 RepID=UPI002E291637|nr:DMT family transporter [Streptomyces sp. NBC_00285]